MPARPPRRPAPGFTLVELLVALSVMALIAVLGWRGLDGMVRTQALNQQRSDDTLALQAGLAQWTTDLEALAEMPRITPIDWDGRVLRLTRRGPASAPEATLVVAWTLRDTEAGPRWLRWQSAALATRGDWQNAWQQALLWAQNPDAAARQREVAVAAAQAWQLLYFRQDAWTNPLSSDASTRSPPAAGNTSPPGPGNSAPPPAGNAETSQTATVPEGVRLVLTLAPDQALSGPLTLDWARPTLGGGKS